MNSEQLDPNLLSMLGHTEKFVTELRAVYEAMQTKSAASTEGKAFLDLINEQYAKGKLNKKQVEREVMLMMRETATGEPITFDDVLRMAVKSENRKATENVVRAFVAHFHNRPDAQRHKDCFEVLFLLAVLEWRKSGKLITRSVLSSSGAKGAAIRYDNSQANNPQTMDADDAARLDKAAQKRSKKHSGE